MFRRPTERSEALRPEICAAPGGRKTVFEVRIRPASVDVGRFSAQARVWLVMMECPSNAPAEASYSNHPLAAAPPC